MNLRSFLWRPRRLFFEAQWNFEHCPVSTIFMCLTLPPFWTQIVLAMGYIPIVLGLYNTQIKVPLYLLLFPTHSTMYATFCHHPCAFFNRFPLLRFEAHANTLRSWSRQWNLDLLHKWDRRRTTTTSRRWSIQTFAGSDYASSVWWLSVLHRRYEHGFLFWYHVCGIFVSLKRNNCSYVDFINNVPRWATLFLPRACHYEPLLPTHCIHLRADDGHDVGVYAVDASGGRYAIFEAYGENYSGDATTGLAFRPYGNLMYACFQDCGCEMPTNLDCGCLLEFWRDDGWRFDGLTLGLNFHCENVRMFIWVFCTLWIQ